MLFSVGDAQIYLGWQFDPVLLGTLLAMVTAYALATGPLRSRLAPGAPFPRRKALWFYGGVLLLYLVEGSPLHDLAERYSLTAHMAQHLGLSYLAAPILIHGTPSWVLRPLLLNPVVKPLARQLTKPLVALVVFNLAFSVWHFPAIYDGALQNTSLHHAEHVLFLLVAFMLWWPLMSPLPELPRPSYLVQLVYLFLIPIAQLPVSALLTFADSVFYSTYAEAPWTLGLRPIQDQTLGGLVMKVGGFITITIPFFLVFFRWYREENGAPYGARPTRPSSSSSSSTPSTTPNSAASADARVR